MNISAKLVRSFYVGLCLVSAIEPSTYALTAQDWSLAPPSRYRPDRRDFRWIKNVQNVRTTPQGKKQIRFVGKIIKGLTHMQQAEYLGETFWAKSIPDFEEQRWIITPQARLLHNLNLLGVTGICKARHFLELKNGLKVILFEGLPPGGTLAYKMLEKRQIPEDEVIAIVLKAARIIRGLHALGVYHWDIKPPNIWIADSGEVLVFDFDLAFRSRHEFYRRELFRTVTRSFASQTKYDVYLHPQLRPPNFPSFADDVYALGKTLLSALSGTTSIPFVMGSPAEDADSHLKAFTKRQNVSRELKTLLQKAIAGGKSDYKTMDAFIQDLARYQDRKSSATPLTPLITPEPQTLLAQSA